MSLYDLQQRTDLILKKYAQYDKPMDKRRETKGEDPFNDEYDMIDTQIDELMRQAEEISEEPNRAIVAARNAEIRKSKQTLLTDGIDGLQKKVKRGKGVTKVLVEERQRRVKALIDKIYAVPDGMGGNRRPFKIPAFMGSGAEGKSAINLSTGGPTGLQANPMYYKGTDETQRFEQASKGGPPLTQQLHTTIEWENSKKRQDAQLDRLEKGVGSLADMARGMQEELDKQVPIIDDIDKQLNSVTSKLKSNNAKLKGLMRSKRNFCIDIVLVCLLLGIVAYVVSMVQKKKTS
ncbi:Syntaxin-72 [Monoraphidium neglectum]|uniref:Syntaxin-72 n=1 Tax=Monoraphidium neglectum TaxID=145388 RepID=A0A0D2K8X4_9CHLO|nr:Syntaxin-72 [Monoraphidium neglectum]KIZ06618.1 Syntaxin-72 [Monoraphidium neglectum]|eukprot:XP_013905637.1 Syntaxin-72 [Monoraphidium neglectum]